MSRLFFAFIILLLFSCSTFAGALVSSASLQPSQPLSRTTIALEIDASSTSSPVLVSFHLSFDEDDNWRELRGVNGSSVVATPGRTELVSWDAQDDLTFHASQATLRITPQDGEAHFLSFTIPRRALLATRGRHINHHMIDYGTWIDDLVVLNSTKLIYIMKAVTGIPLVPPLRSNTNSSSSIHRTFRQLAPASNSSNKDKMLKIHLMM